MFIREIRGKYKGSIACEGGCRITSAPAKGRRLYSLIAQLPTFIYLRGWSEWGNREDSPVVVPEKKK